MLDRLPKVTAKSKKRVGRGYGCGKGGHTAGRGAKGLKARGKVPLIFAGTKSKKSFLKRLPLRRGKGKSGSLKVKPIAVNVGYLNLLPKGTKVDLDALVKHGIVGASEVKKAGVKILGGGKLEKALKVQLPCSKGAREKIKKAGGEVAEEEALNKKPIRQLAEKNRKHKVKNKKTK